MSNTFGLGVRCVAGQDMDLSFVISKASYVGWFFEAAEIVRFSACKDDHLEVVRFWFCGMYTNLM